MNISNKGLRLIIELEGFSSKVYKCEAGQPTIGYGHRLKAEEYFCGKNLLKDRINEWEALQLLKLDVAKIEKNISSDLASLKLNQNEYDATISFIFNIGVLAYKRSTMLKLLKLGERHLAAKEFMRWNKITNKTSGKKVVSHGLTLRREKEYKLFVS